MLLGRHEEELVLFSVWHLVGMGTLGQLPNSNLRVQESVKLHSLDLRYGRNNDIVF